MAHHSVAALGGSRGSLGLLSREVGDSHDTAISYCSLASGGLPLSAR